MPSIDGNKKEKPMPLPEEPRDPDRNDGGQTYGDEPPVRDPKDSPQPERYEV